MGTEAQKLITVSLEKIANCRRRRREMSLHKNLLVTTVIHKARIAIMEETYYMMSYAAAVSTTTSPSDSSSSADGSRTMTTVYCHATATTGPQNHEQYSAGQEPMYYEDRTTGYVSGELPPSSPAASTGPYPYHPQQSVFSASVAVADYSAAASRGDVDCCSEAMEWEGVDSGPVLDPARVRTDPRTVMVVPGAAEVDDDRQAGGDDDEEEVEDEDKENVSPVEYHPSATCQPSGQRSVGGRVRCKKRWRTNGTIDDESTERKRMRWDPLYVTTTTEVDQDVNCGTGQQQSVGVLTTVTAGGGEDDATSMMQGFDPHDEVSTALRFVSVLSASLGGSATGSGSSVTFSGSSQSATGSVSSSSSPYPPPPPSMTTSAGPLPSCQAMRLGRSLSTPELLCSKQAKDSLELMGSRTPVLAIAV